MKAVLWIVLILVLLVAGAGAYLFLNSGALLKSAIETYGSEAVGVPVGVGSVNLSLADGVGQINNFSIGNPEGFGGGDLMNIALVRVGVNVGETTEQVVVLNELVVDAAELHVIAKGRDTNVQTLSDSLDSDTAGGAGSGGTAADEPKLIVDKLQILNTRADVKSDILGETSLNVPDVRLTGVGRPEGGITSDELAQRIIAPITRDVTRELVNQGLGLDEAKEKAKEKVRSELDRGLKRLTDRLKSKD